MSNESCLPKKLPYERFNNKGTEAAIKIVDTKFEFEIDFCW